MFSARGIRVALAALLVAAACSEEHTTSVPIAHTEVPEDLVLGFPKLAARTLIQGEVRQVGGSPGPAGIISDGEPPPDEDAVAQVFAPLTTVGFQNNYAYSGARHQYTGNVGRIDTEAIVSYNGQEIGRQPAFREDYTPFLADFGARKTILAEAYVFIDQDCGLRVDGRSEHRAGWQWFLGGQAPDWGSAGISTQAFPPENQPPCETEPSDDGNYTGGNEDGGADGSGAVTCYYWVTYDPYTGEVYDVDFLFCEGVEGG